MMHKFDCLVFIDGLHQFKIAHQQCEKLARCGKHPLIISQNIVKGIDNDFLRSFSYYQDLAGIHYQLIRQETYDLFHGLAESEVSNGINLRELTKYEGVSLWDLSAKYIFNKIFYFIFNFHIVEQIVKQENPSDIYVFNRSLDLENIIEPIARARQIKLYILNNGYMFLVGQNILFNKIRHFIKCLKRFILSVFFSIVNFLKHRSIKARYDVIFFVPVVRFFDSMFPVILEFPDTKRLVVNFSGSAALEKLRKNNIFFMDFEGYILDNPLNIRSFSIINKIKDVLRKNSFISTKITYKSLSISLFAEDLFNGLFLDEFPLKLRLIDIIRKIISKYGSRACVIADYSRDISLILKSLSVKTLAMQTGHVDEFTLFGPVVADAVTLDGEYWRQCLGERNLQGVRSYVSGPPKYDFLSNGRSVEFNSELGIPGIDKTKKNVVFAGTYASKTLGITENERISQIEAACAAMKDIKEVNFIIKLHPYENDEETYRDIAKKVGLSGYFLVRYIEMLKLIYNCDLLITYFSASSFEAVLMDKDVICLSYSSSFYRQDAWDFKKDKAVIALDNNDDLRLGIRKVLFDQDIKAQLRMNRQKYIYEHAYKMDGKASKRVKEAIDSFIYN